MAQARSAQCTRPNRWPVSCSASLTARCRKISRFGRQAVELLPQARQGDHADAAAQLRLPEDEGQHGDEQIARR